MIGGVSAAVVLIAAGVVIFATQNSSTSSNGTSAANCANVGSGYAVHQGKTVEVFTSVVGDELTRYAAASADFTACTGIKINWNGSDLFEAQLPVRVTGGTAPDLALVPQPGLIAQMVASSKAVPAPTAVADNVNKYWSKSWLNLGSVDGKFYAAPNSANLKSLVWYLPKQFAKYHYTVPTTWAAMFTQSDKMAAAGQTAWCGGIGSGGATGWPATDWLEEVVVREAGATVYNNWISHKVKFSDAPIIHAMNTVLNWMGNKKYVGKVSTIATTSFQDAVTGIPSGGCMQLQQASFISASLPKGAVVSPTGDAWVYYLPGINPAVTTPVEGGDEFYLAFNSKPETVEAQTFLSTPQWAISRIKAAGSNGGWSFHINQLREGAFDARAHCRSIPTQHHEIEVKYLMELIGPNISSGTARGVNKCLSNCHAIAGILIENLAPLAIDLMNSFTVKERNI